MSGGSSPSGETRYNWNEDMAPRWNSLLNTAPWASGAFQFGSDGNVTGVTPRQQYQGTRFAGLDPAQVEAQDYTRNMARMSSSPIGATNAARSQIEGTLGGQYLSGGQSDPHANLVQAMSNPFIESGNGFGSNQYIGESPYFNKMLRDGAEDITSLYRDATEPSLRANAVLNGTLGGGDHMAAQAKNEATLGKTLNNYVNTARQQQFDKSAGLEENRVNRGFQAYQSGMDRGSNAYQAERGRQMQATGLGQNEQGLAYQRIGAMNDMGNFNQGQMQRALDWNYDQWNQNQQHPFQVMDWLSGLYGRAQGGMGANSQVYQGGSNIGQYAGGALALAGLLGGG